MSVSHFSAISSTLSVLEKDATGGKTLTEQEGADVGILIVTATTADSDYVSFPSAIAGKKLIVVNQDAATDVIVKVAGKTGITVGEACTAVLMCNGTDFVRVTADVSNA